MEQRARMVEILKRLSPELLEDLDRRARFVVTPDGFPTGSGDGEVRGSEVGRPTEQATIARVEGELAADPVGAQIRNLFAALSEAAGVLGPVDRWLTNLQAYGDRAVVRESSLAGDCRACLRPVAGTPADRLRSGLCDACRKAYERFSESHPVGEDPGAHRLLFERERRAVLGEEVARPRTIAAGSACPHACCSRVVEHEHWHVPSSCPDCRALNSGGRVAS